MGNDMAITHLTSETTQLAAAMDKNFGFTGACEITAACPKASASLFSFSESAIALTETAGKAVTGGMATAMMTGSPLAAGAVGIGIALQTVFGGGKGGNAR